jgi:calcium-dependent protein kinase
MGCAGSKLPLIENIDGNEAAYHDRFLEDGVLGQGEFGVVKMVHDVKAAAYSNNQSNNEPLACKALRKGMVFKDNTLYSPLKPHVLQSECRILRTLAGKCFNMKLVAVYETPSVIYMVTELCAGGEMMHYVSHTMSDGLHTQDVSRIAYQILSAMDHCAKHRILHRDLKPENIMFSTPFLGSDLRIIDFGSGTMDPPPPQTNTKSEEEEEDLVEHSTFAGTAFYISPEVFQKKYTSKTDVWSIGVVLYVLVAGFPAAELQKAFNILQSSKTNRNLRSLPNLPDNMPDSYYDMLEELLVYRHKKRKTAGQILQDCEFVSFHTQAHPEMDQPHEETGLSLEQIADEAMAGQMTTNYDTSLTPNLSNTSRRTNMTSVLLSGSVRRHTSYLGYQKFERSITTLLATIFNTDHRPVLACEHRTKIT